MTTRNGSQYLWLLPVVLFTVAMNGCGEPTVLESEGPELPVSTQRILAESILGNPTMNSSIYYLCDDGREGFYYGGVSDSEYYIGTLDRSGQQGWVEPIVKAARDLCPLPDNEIGLADAVISVGGIEADEKDGVVEAHVCLMGSGGVIIDEVRISRTDTSMWFNSVDVIGPLSLVAVGGAEIADVVYPLVATFKINPDSTLIICNDIIFHDDADKWYSAVQVDRGLVSGEEYVCYVLAAQHSSEDAASIEILSMSGSTSGTEAYDLTWTTEITHDGPKDIWATTDALVLHGGTLYLAGSADVEKESNPSEGYWDAGFVGSVSTSGVVNWITMVSISTHSENYRGLYVTDDALYAIGLYSEYYTSDKGLRHALAFLSIFETGMGDEVYHLGFGSEEYQSGFNSIFVDGSRAYCGGYTQYVTYGDGFQSWFAEVDIDNLDSADGSEYPAVKPVVKGTESPRPYNMQAEEREGMRSGSTWLE